MEEIQLETTQFVELDTHVFINKELIVHENDGEITINIGDTSDSIVKELDDFYMFRYSPFSWVYYQIEKNVFSFMSPNSWPDPFERLFFNENTNIHCNYVNGCVCMSYVGYKGEETGWNLYKGQEPIVKLEYNLRKLIDQLSVTLTNKSKNENCNVSVYIDVVKYHYDKKDIVAIYKNKCAVSTNPSLPGYSSFADYLTCMTLKRKAFCNEHEIRLFLVSNKKELDLVVYDFDLTKCITKVLLPPLKSYYYSDKRNEYYQSLQDIYNAGMKDYFKNKISYVEQSHLYNIK